MRMVVATFACLSKVAQKILIVFDGATPASPRIQCWLEKGMFV